MRRTTMLAVALATAAGTACDSPTAPRHSEGPGLEPDGARAAAVQPAGPVIEMANGTLFRFVPLADGSIVTVKMHVNARKHANGAVKGSFRYDAGTTSLDVAVTCMTVVEGNKAWIAGVITESTVGFVGHVSYFYAFDNGEGANAPPDIVSLVRVEAQPGLGEAQRFCDELPEILPPRDVERGNINIRG
jgi:hypothetical protein